MCPSPYLARSFGESTDLIINRPEPLLVRSKVPCGRLELTESGQDNPQLRVGASGQGALGFERVTFKSNGSRPHSFVERHLTIHGGRIALDDTEVDSDSGDIATRCTHTNLERRDIRLFCWR